MFQSVRCLCIGAVVVSSAFFATCLDARASVISIWATNQATSAGGSGFFEILLKNETGGSIEVASFDTIVEVALNSGLTFTSADDAIASPNSYIFGTVQNGPLGDFSTAPIARISDFLIPGSTTVADGATFGLARVAYVIDPSTPTGTIAITFSEDLQGFQTHVYDALFDPYSPLSFTGGTISVTGSSAVAEPTSMAIFGIGALSLAYRNRRNRRA